ncbi:MAG: cytochrome c biogenesis protein CcdA [Elusimicrobiota bacterium]|jgi:cytochrome c-type biogenesis protein
MNLAIAFGAGLASFLSPCVLPIIPLYLAYLCGTSYQNLLAQTDKRTTLLHSFCFVLGFSLVFIALGASASALGAGLLQWRGVVERIGGLVLILLGLWMVGLLKAGFLYHEARFHFHDKPVGFAGSVIVGAAFAAGWTPCVGPVLAGILIMASREDSVLKGVLLLTAYSAGFALPFLACALAIDRATQLIRKLSPYLSKLEKFVGGLLVLMGCMLAAGRFGQFSSWMFSLIVR